MSAAICQLQQYRLGQWRRPPLALSYIGDEGHALLILTEAVHGGYFRSVKNRPQQTARKWIVIANVLALAPVVGTLVALVVAALDHLEAFADHE